MDTKEHKKSFDDAYRERQYLMNHMQFPLAEIDKFEWHRGKWGSEYYGYYYRRFTCHTLSRLKVEDGNRLLVIGCGVGGDEKNIKTLYPNIKTTSFDISEEMIRKAVANLSPSDFMVCLAEALPFKDNTFDRILSREVIEHVMDAQKMLFEISRVLKPKGIAVITSENEESFSPKNYYEIKIKAKLANILGIPLFRKNYKDEAPKLSEIKAYAHNTGLDLVEYFWDGALYKSLLRIWKKRLKKFIRLPVSNLAHWFSSLENNRTLAYWFCDQAKYVFKKAEDSDVVVSSDQTKFYSCMRCNGALRELSNDQFRCQSCGQEYTNTDGLPNLVSGSTSYQKSDATGMPNEGKVNQVIFGIINYLLSTIYQVLYFLFALISTLFVKKNNRPLSHLMAADDPLQKNLKKN